MRFFSWAILSFVNGASLRTTWFASELTAARAYRARGERTEIWTSGFAAVLVVPTDDETPVEMLFVEIVPRNLLGDMPAACAAMSTASSEWTIAPTVAGFVCGPWGSGP